MDLIWWDYIVGAMMNVLIVLSDFLFNSFGLSIIVFTIIIRLALMPLSLSQLRATKAMSTLQPKLAELQRKYARDKQKLAQEQMRLYKESGVSPVGCMVPMLIQLPIWYALYQSIILALTANPEALMNLARYLYPWDTVYQALPLDNSFLGMDLAKGNIYLAILVGASMWVQQKMVTPQVGDPRAQAQARMMLWIMPLMFAFFSISFPSGLALYWVVSNIVSIIMQYYVTGWGGLSLSRETPAASQRDKKYARRISSESVTPVKDVTVVRKEEEATQEEEAPEEKRDITSPPRPKKKTELEEIGDYGQKKKESIWKKFLK